ncbi:substrate-binding domain-containing protein [Xanthomonas sp. NCPPB 2654]|uniref:substrate-binding domain-containing protein n=1 Tax=unclassified Xanthomonas TaxID=2643310 RepID=UPI0021DF5CE5|nr:MULTISPECIES: substrate-binding domain-containing protein [unclassified Xanthomonas]MDL5364329.1 substrate-binding domain-containing protein [Xanthomonas sp. NCPPB 2654]UYC20376.1 substrate-binding domain-containing protein [Xanthomonas sp. CFBP 8443]
MLNLNISRFSAIAVAVAALSSGSAMAAENLYGGGATFPAQPYVGTGYLTPNPDARLSTNAGNTPGTGFTVSGIAAGSVFGTYKTNTTNNVSYCQTGSGLGKTALNGAIANQSCRDFSATPVGFSAPTSTSNTPDFIGTDSPLSTNDYSTFLGGANAAARVGLVQIPTIAGAIALPHNDSVDNVALTTAQVCQIYSGQVSNWSSIPGVTGSAGPIKIVYRTDGSGTSFAFTSFLAARCNGTANVPSGFVFTPNQSFTAALPGGASAVYGTRGVSASGNAGVVAAVLSTANADALGYADIGEVVAQAADYATVNGFDPALFGKNASGVPTPISINPTTGLLAGRVLDGATVNLVPGSGSTAVKNCVRLVSPSAAIANAYPIAAITYLAGYVNGNGSAAHIQALKDLYGQFYNTTTRPVLPNGFAYLDGVATFRTSVQSTITNCVQ